MQLIPHSAVQNFHILFNILYKILTTKMTKIELCMQ